MSSHGILQILAVSLIGAAHVEGNSAGHLCPLPQDTSAERFDGIMGKWSRLEECQTLNMFAKEPPVVYDHLDSSSIWVCCPLELSKRIEDDEMDYRNRTMTEGEMHHMMEHFVWFRPQYFHQCREEEGSCRPLQQCGGGDLGGTGFPIMCGWDGGSKHYKYCCSGSGEKLPDIEEPGSATQVVAIKDHVKECKQWASNSPESCENPKNPSFVLMNSACMKSCNVRKNCLDELPSKCEEWRQQGKCETQPISMGLYCRASCGSCGSFEDTNIKTNSKNLSQFCKQFGRSDC